MKKEKDNKFEFGTFELGIANKTISYLLDNGYYNSIEEIGIAFANNDEKVNKAIDEMVAEHKKFYNK